MLEATSARRAPHCCAIRPSCARHQNRFTRLTPFLNRIRSSSERMRTIAVFVDFLRSRGPESPDALQAENLSAFVRSRTAWKPRTIARIASRPGQSLGYLFRRDILPRGLSTAMPTIRLARDAVGADRNMSLNQPMSQLVGPAFQGPPMSLVVA